MELKIGQEFKELIPPLSAEELTNLEQSLLTEGCRDAILTWNDCIIDGHNRYSLRTKNNISFRVEAREFESRNDVCIWMIQNQFGRRNLANYTKGSLSLRLKEYFRKKGKENISNAVSVANANRSENPSCQKSDKMEFSKIDTKKELSRLAGVSYDTIYKVEEIQSQTPSTLLPELERLINSNAISLNQAHKFVRAIKAIQGKVPDEVTVANKILNEFNQNPSVSLESKTKDVIRETQRAERDRQLREAEEKKRLAAEQARRERELKEKAERERLEKERLERERIRQEQLEKEKLRREQWEKERAEKERIRKEKAEQERIKREKLAFEQAEKARTAAERTAEFSEAMGIITLPHPRKVCVLLSSFCFRVLSIPSEVSLPVSLYSFPTSRDALFASPRSLL